MGGPESDKMLFQITLCSRAPKGKIAKMQEMVANICNHTSQQWQRTGWYRATPLTERIGLQQKNTDSSHTLPQSDRAKQRFQRWREQPPFDKEDYFARRLAMDSLTEDDLLT